MPFKIIQGKLAETKADAIVNDENMDLGLYEAAGPQLKPAREALQSTPAMTPGFDLPCKKVIHIQEPIWLGGTHHEQARLEDCYQACIDMALYHHCQSLAMPLICCKKPGFEKDMVRQAPMNVIGTFLETEDMDLTIVVDNKEMISLPEETTKALDAYISKNWKEEVTEETREPETTSDFVKKVKKLVGVEQEQPIKPNAWFIDADDHEEANRPSGLTVGMNKKAGKKKTKKGKAEEKPAYDPDNFKWFFHQDEPPKPPEAPVVEEVIEETVEDAVAVEGPQEEENKETTWKEDFLSYCKQKDLPDPLLCRKANISMDTLRSIRISLKAPDKDLCLALAIALELTLDETREFMDKAKAPLSASDKRDLIVSYFIANGNHEIYEINEALFVYDQPVF